MIVTPIVTLTYDLPSLALAQQVYATLKVQLPSTRFKSVEMIPVSYRIYVDGVYFHNPHIPHNEYTQQASVKVTVAPEDRDYGIAHLKETVASILPDFMKPYGLVLSVKQQTIVTQDLNQA